MGGVVDTKDKKFRIFANKLYFRIYILPKAHTQTHTHLYTYIHTRMYKRIYLHIHK